MLIEYFSRVCINCEQMSGGWWVKAEICYLSPINRVVVELTALSLEIKKKQQSFLL